MQPPFAHVLHAEAIAKLARGRALERGRTYADDGRVTALANRAGGEGDFCKHCVAVAFAWLNRRGDGRP